MWIPACKAPTQFPDVGIPILHWYRSSNIQTHLHRENPRQSEIPDKHQKRREFQPDHGRKEKMMENTCKTCINNDDGLCDHRGILVEDEDSCEHHLAAGKKVRMKRHEKKMDITPAVLYKAGKDVTKEYPAAWFAWSRRTESGEVFLQYGYSVTVNNNDYMFSGVVIGQFTRYIHMALVVGGKLLVVGSKAICLQVDA